MTTIKVPEDFEYKVETIIRHNNSITEVIKYLKEYIESAEGFIYENKN